MLETNDFHCFIQRSHFSQIAKILFRASFFTPADIAAYILSEPRVYFVHTWYFYKYLKYNMYFDYQLKVCINHVAVTQHRVLRAAHYKWRRDVLLLSRVNRRHNTS